MRQAPRERLPPGVDPHGTFPDDACRRSRRDRQCQPAPWGGWRIRKQSCSAGVPVLVVLVVLVLVVLVVVRAPRCCCDPPVYFAMRRTPGGLGHLVEGYAPLWGGDFVMGTGPWWLELHLVGSACYSRPMCAPAACATGVCQTGRTNIFSKKTQCKPFFASPREKSRMKVPWPDLDREPPNSVGTYTRAMRAIDNDPRCLSEVRGTEPRPMVASFAAATKGALVVPACLSTSRA